MIPQYLNHIVRCISSASGYAKFFSRSHNAVVRVYHETGKVIETHEQTRVLKSEVSPPILRAKP